MTPSHTCPLPRRRPLRRLVHAGLVVAALTCVEGSAAAQGFDVWQSPWGPGRKSSGEFFRSAADSAPSDSFTFGNGQNSIAVGGQYFTRIESRTNADFNELLKDNDTFADHRARFSLRTSLGGVLGMVLEFQDVRIWGNERNTVTTEPFTGLHQGFIDLRPAKWLNVRVGRQELTYGEDRLIGNLDWAQSSRAFDGLFVRLQLTDHVTADLFAMDVKERLVLVDPTNAQNKVPNEGGQLYGLYTRWRPSQQLAPRGAREDQLAPRGAREDQLAPRGAREDRVRPRRLRARPGAGPDPAGDRPAR